MKHSLKKVLTLIVVVLVLTLSATRVTSVHAAGLVVNSLSDNTTVDGNCTLREAVRNANDNATTYSDCPAGSGADTITFNLSGTITLGSLLPPITDAAGLTLDGTGQTLTISGNHAVQVMRVNAGASLTLNHLTIANGQVAGNGGGIINYGTLAVTDSVFSGNSPAGSGGGIYNENGTLTITNSTFAGNSTTSGDGGAIYNNSMGNLTITNSTFSGNSVPGYMAGAVANHGGSLVITKSAFLGNSAGYGGGIDTYGSATITNSTFSGNSAVLSNGGGIRNQGTLTITNGTFKGNSSVGIRSHSGTVTLRNTILTSNAGTNCYSPVAFTNGGNNIDDGTSCGWGSASGSMSNTDPLLGPLTDNGGPTQTFALFTGSPAINAGNDGVCAAAPVNGFDQRGVVRPQGAHCDIGSFEYEPDAIAPTVVSATRADTDPTSAQSVKFTLTFSENVTGVDTTDFSLTSTGVSSAAITSVTPVSGAGYTVTVNTGVGSGTIRLDVTDDDSMVDRVGNPLGGWGAGNGSFTTGEVYNVQKTAPTVSSITRANASPTNADSVDFSVSFSEPVSGVDDDDFSLAATGVADAMVSGVSGSGAVYTVSVDTGSGSGTIRLDVVDNDSIVSATSNPLGGMGAGNGNFTTGAAYTIDKSAPDTQIDTHPDNPTNSTSATFTFSSADGTASFECSLDGDGWAACVSPKNYTSLSEDVLYTFEVRAKDSLGNLDATPAFYSWIVYTAMPTVSSITRAHASPTNAASVDFTVSFSEPMFGVDDDDFSLATTGVTDAMVSGVSGSGATYTVSVNTGSGSGTIRLDLVDNDSIASLTSNPLGGWGAGNGDFATGETYTVQKDAPTLLSPTGTIIDTTPTYKWDKIAAATQYQYQLLKGSKTIYTKTVAASVCGSTCANTPTTVLLTGAYKWRVRAMVNGQWKEYSAYMTFTVAAAKPGFWKGSKMELYVLPTGTKVDNFAISINITGCGTYKITHTPLVSILNKSFAFKGSFYAKGTFSSPTVAKGTLGLKSLRIPGCGSVTGGPFSWTAKWKNSNQALVLDVEEIRLTVVEPGMEADSFFDIVETMNP